MKRSRPRGRRTGPFPDSRTAHLHDSLAGPDSRPAHLHDGKPRTDSYVISQNEKEYSSPAIGVDENDNRVAVPESYIPSASRVETPRPRDSLVLNPDPSFPESHTAHLSRPNGGRAESDVQFTVAGAEEPFSAAVVNDSAYCHAELGDVTGDIRLGRIPAADLNGHGNSAANSVTIGDSTRFDFENAVNSFADEANSERRPTARATIAFGHSPIPKSGDVNRKTNRSLTSTTPVPIPGTLSSGSNFPNLDYESEFPTIESTSPKKGAKTRKSRIIPGQSNVNMGSYIVTSSSSVALLGPSASSSSVYETANLGNYAPIVKSSSSSSVLGDYMPPSLSSSSSTFNELPRRPNNSTFTSLWGSSWKRKETIRQRNLSFGSSDSVLSNSLEALSSDNSPVKVRLGQRILVDERPSVVGEPLREPEANLEDNNRLPVSTHQREINDNSQIDPVLGNNIDDQIVTFHDRQSTNDAKESKQSPSKNESSSMHNGACGTKENGACGAKEEQVIEDPFGLAAVNVTSRITTAEDERFVRRAARGRKGGAVAKVRGGGLSGNSDVPQDRGQRKGRLDLGPQLRPQWRQQHLSCRHPHFNVDNGPSPSPHFVVDNGPSSPSPHFDVDNSPSSPSPHFDVDNVPSSSSSLMHWLQNVSSGSPRVGEMPSSATSKCHARGRLDREDDDASAAAAAAASELELIDLAGTTRRDQELNSSEGKIFVLHACVSYSFPSCRPA